MFFKSIPRSFMAFVIEHVKTKFIKLDKKCILGAVLNFACLFSHTEKKLHSKYFVFFIEAERFPELYRAYEQFYFDGKLKLHEKKKDWLFYKDCFKIKDRGVVNKEELE